MWSMSMTMPDILISGAEVPTSVRVTIAGPPVAVSQTSRVTSSTVTTSSQTQTEGSQQSGQTLSTSTSTNIGPWNTHLASPTSSVSRETLPSITYGIFSPPSLSTTEDTTTVAGTKQPAWISSPASASSAPTTDPLTQTDNSQSSSSTTGSDSASSSPKSILSQMMPQQSDASTNTLQRPPHPLPIKLVAAVVVACIVALIIGILLFWFWKRQKVKRKEQQEKLNGNAVWYNRRSTDNDFCIDGSGENRSGSPVGDNTDNQPSALILPKSASRAHNQTLDDAQRSQNNYSNDSNDPFLSPRSQISFPEHLTLQTPPRDSPEEGNGSMDASGTGLQASACSSVETVIHRPSHKNSDPFTDQAAFERRDKHRSFQATAGSRRPYQTQHDTRYANISDGNDHCKSSDLQLDSTGLYLSTFLEQSYPSDRNQPSQRDSYPGLNTAQDEGICTFPPREESDIDLARKVIRGLKKQAFEAQKAAAAAELQAKAIRDAQ